MPREKIFLIGYPKHQLTGCKLPSKGECLRVLFYHIRVGKLSVDESARLVVEECSMFWKKARIPVQEQHRAAKRLKDLYEEHRKLLQTKTRNTPHYVHMREEFEEGLKDLFDIAIADALSRISKEEDREFLQKQREKGRVGCMLGTDQVLAKKEARIQKRKEEEASRIMKHLSEASTSSSIATGKISNKIR